MVNAQWIDGRVTAWANVSLPESSNEGTNTIMSVVSSEAAMGAKASSKAKVGPWNPTRHACCPASAHATNKKTTLISAATESLFSTC